MSVVYHINVLWPIIIRYLNQWNEFLWSNGMDEIIDEKKGKKKQNVFPFSFHHINNYVMFHGSVILVQNINMWTRETEYYVGNQSYIAITLGGFESLVYGPCRSDGCSINSPIEKQHHKHWNVETSQGAINYITSVVC